MVKSVNASFSCIDCNIFLIPSKDGVFTSNLLYTELITKEQLHTVQLIDTPVSINEHRR